MIGTKKIRITLAHLFGFSLLGLIVLLVFLFYLLLHTSRASVIQSSDNLRATASREFADKVSIYLNQLQQTENNFQAEIDHEVFNPKNLDELETFLFTSILSNDNLSEISFTYGDKMGYDPDGNILLAPTGRGEMTLYRKSRQDSSLIDTFLVYQQDEQWVSKLRTRSAKNEIFGTPFVQVEGQSIVDPTTDLTFVTPANKQYAGKTLWSDLHWSEIDKDLPESQRRVEVSIQRAITDSTGNFLGVFRAGLFYDQIDLITHFKLVPQDLHNPYLVFITDDNGELITRLNSKDTLSQVDNNLRFSSTNAPQQVQIALKDPTLNLVSETSPLQFSQFKYQGNTYLLTYRRIEGSQGWILGIVVPQSYYVASLEEMQNRLLLMTGIIICCIGLSSFFVMRFLKKELQKILNETLKMHNFDFKASLPRSIFEDIYTILVGLEGAKTVMRTMSKYIPLELVKQLFQSQKDPVLGGEVQEISILFTDIQNFTSIAEKLPVNQLAAALGSYLKVMTLVIQNRWQGVIDKFLGDGIMVLWNTPTPQPNHHQISCQATLDCTAALRELFDSPQWQGLPRFETRFGLHSDRVMVGHFGAPDRLNFTALGNGVNIASRLESLNKYYGTSIIVSENIYKAAQNDFVFRLLDSVMLKGETKKLSIYELIDKKGGKLEMGPIISKYEQALEAYRQRLFKDAIHLLQDQLHDGPSRVLSNRCSQFLQSPPPDSWDGSFVFIEK